MDAIFSDDIDEVMGYSQKEKRTELYFGTVIGADETIHQVIIDCCSNPIRCRAGCDARVGDTVVVMVPKCGRPCTLCQLTEHNVR
jgi:hypothetical protein